MPLRNWAGKGFLALSPGEVIDYRDVRARLDWAKQMFDLQDVCWDPWNSRQISSQMIDDGFSCKEVRQGYATLSEPTKKVLELIVNGKLHHGGHPGLRWQAGCAAKKPDGNDNIQATKPDLQKSTSR